jgi:uncharacterized protein YwqG
MLPFGLNAGGIVAVLILLAVLFGPAIVRRLAKRQPAVVSPPRKTPSGPALDPESLQRWIADNETACAWASVSASPPADPLTSRLGGPAWLADGEEWPVGRDGLPMLFIAQINFADVPPLPDYPDSGLLQLFVADNDVWGLDFEEPLQSDHRVIWRPVPDRGRLVPPPSASQSSPLDPDVQLQGRGLTFRSGRMPPDPGSASFAEAFPGWWYAENAALVDALFNRNDTVDEGIYVGGHPRFTQDDVRDSPALAAYDRVALQVGYVRDVVMWGDVGEATWLVTRKDLAARDFSRVLYSWDCH